MFTIENALQKLQLLIIIIEIIYIVSQTSVGLF